MGSLELVKKAITGEKREFEFHSLCLMFSLSSTQMQEKGAI